MFVSSVQNDEIKICYFGTKLCRTMIGLGFNRDQWPIIKFLRQNKAHFISSNLFLNQSNSCKETQPKPQEFIPLPSGLESVVGERRGASSSSSCSSVFCYTWPPCVSLSHSSISPSHLLVVNESSTVILHVTWVVVFGTRQWEVMNCSFMPLDGTVVKCHQET